MQSHYFKEIGERIRKVRTDAGMTQRDFAEKVESSRTYLSRVESGKQQASRALLAGIRDNFGVTLGWLLEGLSSQINEPANSDHGVTNVTGGAPVKDRSLASRANAARLIGKLLTDRGAGIAGGVNIFGYGGLAGMKLRLMAARDKGLGGSRLYEIVEDDELWMAAGDPTGREFEILRGYYDFGGDRSLVEWMECLRVVRWVSECVELALDDEDMGALPDAKTA